MIGIWHLHVFFNLPLILFFLLILVLSLSFTSSLALSLYLYLSLSLSLSLYLKCCQVTRLAQFALTSSHQRRIPENLAVGMAQLGPVITFETVGKVGVVDEME